MEENRFYVGIIMLKTGWHKMFTDGNKHYTFEPIVDEKKEKNKEKRKG